MIMAKTKWAELRPQVQEVWRLSLPAILTQITTIAMQYIDSAMVGALGANASAAIGLVATATWLLSGVTYAVSAGFSVQAAHRIGGGDNAGARTVVRHGLVSAIIVAGLMGLGAAGISGTLPVWLGGAEEITADASAYFFTFALMLPFSQINSMTSSFLQCCGDMVTPSILNAVMCVLDVIFNALLIPRYGVLGAGLGTTLACAVTSMLMLWFCCARNSTLRLKRGEKSPLDMDIIKNAVKIGAPVAVQEIAMNGALVVSTMIIAPLGTVAIAANSFAVTAENLCYMPGFGIASAAATVVGRSVGAGDAALAKRYGNICTALGAAFLALFGAVLMFACPLLFRFLTPDLAVRQLAAQVLRIELFAEPLFGVSIVAAGVLRGAGDTFVPSLLNLGSIWIVRIGLARILVEPLGLHGMWLAMATELCVRGLLMLYRQHTSKYYSAYNRV